MIVKIDCETNGLYAAPIATLLPHLCKVDALEAAQCPELVVVEVDVPRGAALLREEGVCQRAARLVKRVPVPVLPTLPPAGKYLDI